MNSQPHRHSGFVKRNLYRLAYYIPLKRGWLSTLSSHRYLWAVSDAIHLGPVGPNAWTMPEVDSLKQTIANKAIPDSEVHALLVHPNPWVVGYAYEILLARRSPLAHTPPDSLKNRHEEVHMGLGCFVIGQPLSDYVAKRYYHTFDKELWCGEVS